MEIMVVRPAHSRKTPCPMDVTLLGIVTDAKFVHPENAYSPTVVTLLGMMKAVRPLQSEKAP